MKKLIELIKEQFEDESIEITKDSIVSNLNGFDSLTAFSIIDSVEESNGFQLDENDLNLTVEQIYNKINE
jgi:acyl carrier protein